MTFLGDDLEGVEIEPPEVVHADDILPPQAGVRHQKQDLIDTVGRMAAERREALYPAGEPGLLCDDAEGLDIEPPGSEPPPFPVPTDAANPHPRQKGGRFGFAPGRTVEEQAKLNAVSGDGEAVREASQAKIDAEHAKVLMAPQGERLKAMMASPTAIVDGYTGMGYSEINGSLYKGEEPNERVLRMDAAFEDPRIAVTNSDPISVVRGMGESEVAAMGGVKPGEVYIADGFLSTGTEPSRVESHRKPGTRLMNITVPPGTPMLAGEKVERELILQRGGRLRYNGVADNMMQFDWEGTE